ncbi:MAG: cysteine desulfurase, partial [Lachnospiraceae bacterium]|nr:cysteine desulfurase [Lachnospiraceae bacterium]
NSATTRVFDSVRDVMVQAMMADYGNTSSRHMKGVEAEHYIKSAREEIAKSLKVKDKEIIFTSGGTESNNMALIGVAMANKRAGNHLITTGIEHASIYNTMIFLEEQGFRVTYLPTDENGHVSLDALREAICDETILISVMYVNNEMGAVEPIEEIAKIIKEKKSKAYFHVDAIQAYGKYVIRPKKMGIDLMSVSAHKIHGPKGVGFLYVDEKVKIKPIIFGGGQQKNMRSGTENVPGCAGMGMAVKEMYTNHEAKVEQIYALKDRMVKGLQEIEGVTVHGLTGRDSAPQIVSAGFEGVRAEVLLHALEDRGVYVSSGSACSSNHPGISGTLKGIGVKDSLLDSTLRFSFGLFNTEDDVDYCLEQLRELLPMLRRYRRA